MSNVTETINGVALSLEKTAKALEKVHTQASSAASSKEIGTLATMLQKQNLQLMNTVRTSGDKMVNEFRRIEQQKRDELQKSSSIIEQRQKQSSDKQTKQTSSGTKQRLSIWKQFYNTVDKWQKYRTNRLRQQTTSYVEQTARFFKQQLAWYPTKQLTFAVLGVPGNVIKSTMDYGDALTQVASISRFTQSQLTELDSEIKSIATTTKLGLLDITEATKSLVQAGFRGDEVTKALRPISNLSIATNAAIQETSNLMATVFRAFHKSTIEFEQISDRLANAVVNSRLTLSDLNTAFNYVASASAQTGVSLEETIALLGTLTNAGLKSTTAATGLRMTLLKLAAPTKKATKVLERVGLTKSDLDPAVVGIKEVINQLSKLSREDIIEIFSARSANAVLALTNAGSAAINQLELAIKEQGTASTIANLQVLTLKQSWENLKQTAQVAAVEAGKVFEKELAVVFRTLSSLINDNIDLVKILSKVVVAVGPKLLTISAGILSMTAALKFFNIQLSLSGKLFKLISTEGLIAGFSSWLVALNPIVVGLGSIAALIGAITFDIIQSRKEFEQFKTTITQTKVSTSNLVAELSKVRAESKRLASQSTPEFVRQITFSTDIEKVKDQLNDYVEKQAKLYKLNREKTEELRKTLFSGFEQIKPGDYESLTTWLDSIIAKIPEILSNKLVELRDEFTKPVYIDDVFGSVNFKITGDSKKVNFLTKQIEEEKKSNNLIEIARKIVNEQRGSVAQLTSLYAEVSGYFTSGKAINISTYDQIQQTISQLGNILSGALIDTDDNYLKQLKERFDYLEQNAKNLKVKVTDANISSAVAEKLNTIKKQLKSDVSELTKLAKAGQLSEGAVAAFEEITATYEDQIADGVLKSLKAQFGATANVTRAEVLKVVQEGIQSYFPGARDQELLSQQAEISIGEFNIKLLDEQIKQARNLGDDNAASLAIARIKAKKELDKLKIVYQAATTGISKEQQRAFIKLQEQNKQFESKVTSLKEAIAANTEQQSQVQSLMAALGDNITPQQFSAYTAEISELKKKEITLSKDLAELLKGDPTQYNRILGNIEILSTELENMADNARFSIKNIVQDLESSFSSGFGNFFNDLIDGTKSVSEAFRGMARDILSSITKATTNRLVEGLVNGAFNSGGTWAGFLSAFKTFTLHNGGVVGKDFTSIRNVDPRIFNNAQRFHDGLYPNEFPAILEKGETVIPKNTGVVNQAPKVTINVSNSSNQQVTLQTDSTSFDGEEYIVNTIIKNISTNGALRSIV